MLVCKFHMCTDDLKITLLKAYCTPLNTAHLWGSDRKANAAGGV